MFSEMKPYGYELFIVYKFDVVSGHLCVGVM